MLRSLWRSRLCLVLPIAVLASAFSTRAHGQVTTAMLIGDAVPEVTSKYADVDQAIQRFNNRDIAAARLLLETAKQKDPTLPPTDISMAKLYFAANNAAAARNSLEKTALDVPNDPEAYLILADQALRGGRFIEAESLYDKSIGLIDKFSENPKRKRNFQIQSRAGRASIYERRKDWPLSEKDLQEWVSVDGDNPVAHYRLGQSQFMQKKFPAGYKEFETARQKDKDNTRGVPLPDVAAALLYDQLGQQDKAKQFFDRAIAAGKTDATAAVAYAQWLIKNGKLPEADTFLADARKTNPTATNLFVLSGIAARMAKQAKPAEDFFMEAVRISPANADTLNQLALLLVEQADPTKRQRALEFAGISSRLNAESADAQITLAWVLFQLNRPNDAEQALRTGLQLGNLNPDSRYLVAKMLADRNPTAAAQILQEALETDSGVIFINREDAKTMLEALKKK